MMSVWESISGAAITFYRAAISENLFIEKLACFKQNEKPEAALLVANNPERTKLVIAWINLDVKRTEKLTDFKGESQKDTLEWFWENAMYSKRELNEMTGTHLLN